MVFESGRFGVEREERKRGVELSGERGARDKDREREDEERNKREKKRERDGEKSAGPL